MTRQLNYDNGLQARWTERQHLTAPTKNWRFSVSYDSFVVNQTFVLRMKFSGENRQLLVAAKRYVAFLKSNYGQFESDDKADI
jgi:hypothetical protein